MYCWTAAISCCWCQYFQLWQATYSLIYRQLNLSFLRHQARFCMIKSPPTTVRLHCRNARSMLSIIRSTMTTYNPVGFFLYPGYFSYWLRSNSINSGQPRPPRAPEILSVKGCKAFVRSSYKPVTKPGASAWMSWKMKHCRLFPSARVAPLKTPLVRAVTSTPVKELVVPVLPPTERRRAS